MKPKTLKDIKKLAAKYDKKLRATDKRFDNCVSLVHKDGSSFLLKRAFVMTCVLPAKISKYYVIRDEELYYVIFSEHHGFKLYSSTEIKHLEYYKKVDATKGKLK